MNSVVVFGGALSTDAVLASYALSAPWFVSSSSVSEMRGRPARWGV